MITDATDFLDPDPTCDRHCGLYRAPGDPPVDHAPDCKRAAPALPPPPLAGASPLPAPRSVDDILADPARTPREVPGVAHAVPLRPDPVEDAVAGGVVRQVTPLWARVRLTAALCAVLGACGLGLWGTAEPTRADPVRAEDAGPGWVECEGSRPEHRSTGKKVAWKCAYGGRFLCDEELCGVCAWDRAGADCSWRWLSRGEDATMPPGTEHHFRGGEER